MYACEYMRRVSAYMELRRGIFWSDSTVVRLLEGVMAALSDRLPRRRERREGERKILMFAIREAGTTLTIELFASDLLSYEFASEHLRPH
jgi:hypothetical protein